MHVRLYACTLMVWLIVVGIDAAWYVVRAFNLLPTDEVYANSLAFQLLAYGLTRLPFWIVGLMLLLVLEISIFGRKSSEGR